MAKRRKRRLVTRRRVKWIGTLATVVIVAMTVLSMFGIVAYWQNIGSDGSGRGVFLGPFEIEYIRRGPNAMSAQFGPDGFYFFALGPSKWSMRLMPFFARSAQRTAIAIPHWIPLLLIAVPTAWLWHTDRRAKPWQCATCRYDLRGLNVRSESEPTRNVRSESGPTRGNGVCPECGTPTPRTE